MGEDLQDIKYVNRDGDSMRGPLALSGDPVLDAHAASKRYIDTVLANLRALSLLRDGSQAMTGPLTLAGPPTSALHASSRSYVDNVVAGAVAPLATVVYVDAQDVIERAYADALDAATRIYVDAQDVIDRAYTDTEIAARATYDAIVAPAGGDYTSIVAACVGEAAGARIFIKSGTYLETADIELRQGQQLIGENRDSTIIDFGGGNFQIDYVAFTYGQNEIRNLTVQGSIDSYAINMNGDDNRVDNCLLIGTAAGFSGLRTDGIDDIVSNCHFTGFSRAGEFGLRLGSLSMVYSCIFEASDGGLNIYSSSIAWGNDFRTIAACQVFMAGAGTPAGPSLIGNQLLGNAPITINVDMVTISGNLIDGATGIYWDAAYDQATIVANTFYDSLIDCDKTGSEECIITGNTFRGGGGISCDGQRWTISGNSFEGTAAIVLDANSLECAVTGNSMYGSTAGVKITDNGSANLAMNNYGVPLLSEKNYTRTENTSGGALVEGDVVVIRAVAAGDEFTTTVNQGDDMVLGMCDAGVNNNAFGPVQTEGFTDKLKVNGVANIGIGDLLGTHTVAGIARQAAAGDMAFAIALEAYAGADSNGVIDALLIKPRKV